jgi:hypothetical protein
MNARKAFVHYALTVYDKLNKRKKKAKVIEKCQNIKYG